MVSHLSKCYLHQYACLYESVVMKVWIDIYIYIYIYIYIGLHTAQMHLQETTSNHSAPVLVLGERTRRERRREKRPSQKPSLSHDSRSRDKIIISISAPVSIDILPAPGKK